MFAQRKKKPTSIEVKAGKANLEDKKIISDPRKGSLKFSISDDLIIVQWSLRDSSEPIDEYFSVPGELQFIKVQQCKDGRMYYLKFSSSDKKEFYWLQEPNPENDSKLEETIRSIINNTEDEPLPTTNNNTNITTPAPSTLKNEPVTPSKPIASSTLQTPQSVLPTTTSSSSTTASRQPANTSSPIPNLDLFKDIFSSLPQTKSTKLNLSTILNPENLLPILKNPQIQSELKEHLPEEMRSSQDIIDLVHTPQFAQAVDQLNYAIYDGHGSEIVQQLGYEPSIMSMRGVEGFLTSIQEGVNKQQKEKQEKEKDKMQE